MAVRKFFGSNTQPSSRKTFNERARYRNFVILPEISEKNPGMFRDFWFIENMYYGRIDLEHRFIMAKEELLTPIETENRESALVFNFVADAFKNFIKDYDKALSSGKIHKDDNFLAEVRAVKGYVSPVRKYDLHLASLEIKFQKQLFKDHRRVENFVDFVDYFLEYNMLKKDITPITLTGFMASHLCSPGSSGLFIELTELDYGFDKDKIDNFIDSPNFKFFVKNCSKHGFMIDKNVPWRICANIGSLEMARYMIKHNVSMDSIFTDYYTKFYMKDINYLMDYLLKFYNRFVSIKPYIRKEIYDGSATYRFSKKRIRITKEHMNLLYDDSYKINLYINLRNWETYNRYSKSLIDRLKRNALDYFNLDGIEAAYDYIDRQFKGFLNDMGAYNAFMRKQEAKKENLEIIGQDIEDELLQAVAEARKTIY